MATIVMMPAPRPGLPASADQRGGATILFFTGVRYEREIDSEPVASLELPAPHATEINQDARVAL